MESKVNYTLVGLFVIILGMALLGAILWLTIGIQPRVYDEYKVYIRESVSGLNPRASVKYRGVDVGQVVSIRLDPDNPEQVELLLQIERNTPVREDTKAVLTVQGLTGLAYVELTGGSRDSPPLEPTPEQPVPVIDSGPSLVARLDNAFDNLLTTFITLSDRIEVLLSEENQAAFGQALTNLETITTAVADRSEMIGQTLANLETITTTVAGRSDTVGMALDNAASTFESSARIGTELTPLLGRVSAGVVALEEMSKTITETSRSLSAAVEESRQDIQRLARTTTPELNSLLTQLGQLADTLQRFVQELDRNPRMLLFGKPSGRPGPGE